MSSYDELIKEMGQNELLAQTDYTSFFLERAHSLPLMYPVLVRHYIERLHRFEFELSYFLPRDPTHHKMYYHVPADNILDGKLWMASVQECITFCINLMCHRHKWKASEIV